MLAAGLIVLAATAAYSNSLQCSFVFDDKGDIVNNTSIRHLWPIWDVFVVAKRRPGSPARPAGGEPLAGRQLCHRRSGALLVIT